MENPTEFKNQDLTGSIERVTFEKKRKMLCSSIRNCLKLRFDDINSGVIAATQIACFKTWPCFNKEKDKIEGKVLYINANEKCIVLLLFIYFNFDLLVLKFQENNW